MMHTRQRSVRHTGVRRLLYPSLTSVLTLLALLCSLTLWTVIAAPPPSTGGNLDPTFDGDGIVITNINNYDAANDLVIQPDGKIVVAGASGTFLLASRGPTPSEGPRKDFTVARYNTDGSLDNTFGSGGIVTTVIGDDSVAKSVALQPDGKIVVAGESQWDTQRITAARYDSDGTLDNTFGTGGIVTVAIADLANAEDLVIQPDGKIVLAGDNLDLAAFTSAFTFVRFNVDGSLDSTFGTGGVFAVPQTETAQPTFARAVALQTDGKIVATGLGFDEGPTSEITVVRLNSNGSLDSTFGGSSPAESSTTSGGGIVFTNVSDDQRDTGNDLVIQPDGKIVVAGTSISADTGNSVVVLARYNTNGSLDTSFGTNGVAAPTITETDLAFASGIALQTDGKIVVAQARDFFIGFFAVSRYQANGSPDATFGSGGTVTTPIGDFSGAAAVAIQTDGKIVAAGAGNVSIDFDTAELSADIAVVRYNPGGAVNNPPVVTITGPASGSVFAVNTAVNFTGTFTDDAGDTHTAQWTFDSVPQSATVVEPSGSTPGTANTTHTFTAAGVYKVTLTVTDNGNLSGTANTVNGLDAMVVIYDPNAGFVTGGGSIMSPAGAFVPMPELTGKASFGFVSKYQNGASVPTGNTEFQFKAGALNFSSTSYEWLVISGKKAQYKGFGTINGSGNYRFMLTAIDGQQPGGGGVDKFRMRIWSDANGLIYDNQLNAPDSDDPTTVIGGGSIVIHH